MNEKRPDERWTRRSMLAGLGGAAAGGVAFAAPTPGPHESNARSRRQVAQRLLDAVPEAGAWVELDRSAVAANLAAVRRRAGGRPVMGVVKANAYGHGLAPMARMLADAGVDALMVITVDEALAVRAAGIRTPVLNYGPFDRPAAAELIEQDVDQAVYTREAVEGLAAAARGTGKAARVHLVLDTGLGRVGVPAAGAAEVFEAAASGVAAGTLQVGGIATALTEDLEYDRVQLARFEDARERARATGLDAGTRHVASSAAVLDFPEAHLDMVRPGIMLYGHYPNDRSRAERPIELAPVLSLKARIAYVKTLAAGDSIGYHRAWIAERATTVATLPIGHSQGYPARALAAGGWVEIHGRACPLVGGITSDHLEVAIPDGLEVRVGDIATLIAGVPGTARPGDGATAGGARVADAGESQVPPTAPMVGEWDGAGVYGVLMHLSPLLPRMIR